jgi:MFS family permease
VSGPSMSATRPAGLRWYVLIVLFLICAFNFADRFILSILAQNIKAELALSDWEVGLLIGPASAFLYAILGIPMAYLADRVNRVGFLAVCLTIWSVLTALGGASSNALQLAAARIGVSSAEAGGSPSSSSIIADYFPRRERPMAMGIYAAGIMVGICIAFAAGSLLNAAVGWRRTLMLAGAPGIPLAILLFSTVREPIRGSCDTDDDGNPAVPSMPVSMIASLRVLWHSTFYRQMVIAAGASTFCVFTVLHWGPSLIIRKFYGGSSAGTAGIGLGIGIALSGGLASVIGGRVTTGLAGRGMIRPLRLAALLQMLGGPLMLAAWFAPTLELCLLLLGLSWGFLSFFSPIFYAAAQSDVPSHVRGMALAVLLLIISIVSNGLSAPIIGLFSDVLRPTMGEASLQYALAIATLPTLLTAFLLFRAAKLFSHDKEKSENTVCVGDVPR